jgi:hypothetical protein
MTQPPISAISPVSSATGMNAAGGTEPSSAEFHLSSASNAATPPDARSITGW